MNFNIFKKREYFKFRLPLISAIIGNSNIERIANVIFVQNK